MAPRGKKMKTGLKREDAARDRMIELGFQKQVITESIKQLIEVYGDQDQWFLIEDANYSALLSICLENQEKQDKQLAGEEQANQLAGEEQANQLATEEQANQLVEEMAEKEEEEEKDAVMDSAEKILPAEEHDEMGQKEQKEEKKAGKAVMDSGGYAHHSVEGAESSHCGWLSSEDEDTDSSDDDYVLAPR